MLSIRGFRTFSLIARTATRYGYDVHHAGMSAPDEHDLVPITETVRLVTEFGVFLVITTDTSSLPEAFEYDVRKLSRAAEGNCEADCPKATKMGEER